MKIKELLIDLESMSFDSVLEYIVKKASTKDEKVFIATPNVEIFMMELENPEYRGVIKRADLALPDSIGVLMAGKILGISLKERIPGSILFERLAGEVSKRPITVGFLGGKPGVALKASKRLVNNYPGLKIAFAVAEWPQKNDAQKLACDILFVAFGSPKQEVWIDKNLKKINVKVAIGVGGSFDYLAEEVRRAPKFVSNAGFEWLFRLIMQPWRAKRQARLLKFVYLVAKEKLSTVI